MDPKEMLLEELMREGYLYTPAMIEAFREIDRKDFVPYDLRDYAYENTALPIGYGQTISQPAVVAFMLEKLEPEPGQKFLDIGSGSGWVTTLLVYIVSKSNSAGKVIAIERIPELKEYGEKNCAKYHFVEKGIAKFVMADGTKGYPQEAPFDGIHAAASASKDIPSAWKEQLKIGGRIVAPIGQSIWVFIKNPDGGFSEEEYPGFAFVPLVKE